MSEIPTIDHKIVKWRVVDEESGKMISQIKKERPRELGGCTYALKSQLLKSTLYITINNIEEGGTIRPFEVFFNTRDSSKFVELQIITRLISAIFRRTRNAVFVVDELKAVANPENTGYFRPPRTGETKGCYIPSIFYEIGEIIEDHFKQLNFNDPRIRTDVEPTSLPPVVVPESDPLETGVACPECHKKTLRKEGGCEMCSSCGYSRCG